MSARRRIARRGITLIEVLIAFSVLALVATLVYGAFDVMSRTRNTVESSSERYHQGRSAVSRIARDIQASFLSLHRPVLNPGLQVSQTIFRGTESGVKGSRVDFTSFSHRRLGFGTHESDQNELSYFIAQGKGKTQGGRDVATFDLARRESTMIDMEPTTGGVVQILAEDVVEFRLEYLDGTTGDWKTNWDSTAPETFERLPRQVRVELAIARSTTGPAYRFATKVPIAMQSPLIFGLSQ